MGSDKLLKQAVIPGLRALRGAERVADMPGVWAINPAELSERKFIDRALKRTGAEGDLAQELARIKEWERASTARNADMLQGVLQDMLYGASIPGAGKDIRGLLYVSPSGEIRGGTSINTEKSAEYLKDLDFTKKAPNYLEYVATTTPEVKGSDLLRKTQDLYGNDTVFQVADPDKNIPIYSRWGAKRMPPNEFGRDVLGGGEHLPAFRIEDRIPEDMPVFEDPNQMRLPGFAGGGVVRNNSNLWSLLAMPKARARVLADMGQQIDREKAARELALKNYNDSLPESVMRLTPEERMAAVAKQKQYDDITNAVNAARTAKTSPSFSEGQARTWRGPALGDIMAGAPIEGLKGMVRGAVSAPAFLADLGALTYAGASKAMGRPDQEDAAHEFSRKYGSQGVSDWIAENVPGLGRSKTLDDVGAIGELIGMGIDPRMASRAYGKMSADAIARSSESAPRSLHIDSEALLTPEGFAIGGAVSDPWAPPPGSPPPTTGIRGRSDNPLTVADLYSLIAQLENEAHA